MKRRRGIRTNMPEQRGTAWGGGGEDAHSHGATGRGQPLGQEAGDGG